MRGSNSRLKQTFKELALNGAPRDSHESRNVDAAIGGGERAGKELLFYGGAEAKSRKAGPRAAMHVEMSWPRDYVTG